MDAPEGSGNRIGRTIWTVWGYLSGAVARYLRPEVTDEGNQSVRSRDDKIVREVKASEKEEKKYNQNDKSTAEIKCSPPESRVQVASVLWENTDVVKDDENVELHVDAARKQTYPYAMWLTETGHEGSVSGDSESQGCKSAVHIEKEAVLSDEGQAEKDKTDCKENETALELDETGQIEQKDGADEESDQKHEDEKCSTKTEDPDNADVTVQAELYAQDVEQEIVINMIDRGETESIGGFKHADERLIDEMEKNIVGLKDREKTEIDEDQRSPSQVQDLLPEPDYSTEEAGTESEQDITKSDLLESGETQLRVSREISDKNKSNNEMELKNTSVLDDIFENFTTSEDTLMLDSKQDTLENTSETGRGLPVVAIKTEGMLSDLIVCEFPDESRKWPETALGCYDEIKINLSLAEQQTETETYIACSVEHPETQKAVEEAIEIEQDIETPIESLDATESQAQRELDETKFSLKEHVELRTGIVETTEAKISPKDEQAEPFATQSQRNVTFQTHELLEFTERECQSPQETMDTFSESLENSSVSEITGTARIEHVAEDQTDVKHELTKTLSPAESLVETLDLQGESEQRIEEQEPLDTDLGKRALEYVEEITNQVLKEMIETEMNLVQETETLVGLSTEELGDAEYQGPEECESAAFVLEEERKLLGETMGSMVERKVETTRKEVAKQNESDIISPETTTEADGHHEQQTCLCAEANRGGSTHVETEAVSSNEGQAEGMYANSESKESETPLELDETGQIEQNDGNDEECDQNHEDEKCERNNEDAENTDTTVKTEVYVQDVEPETVINMMDHGETESIGGFRHADETENNIVDQNDHKKAEIEDQRPELQEPADAFVPEEERKLLGETMDSKMELEVENASSEVKQNEQHIHSPECVTTEADGHHEQQTYLCAGNDSEGRTHVENEAVSSDEGQAEGVCANSECKESEMALELDETGQIEQNDGNDEECNQNHEDEKCERNNEDAENTDSTVQSEVYGQDVEQEIVINMDHGETESIGVFILADEKENNIVDLNAQEKAEIEDQRPELQVPDDAFVPEEEMKLLGETMDSKMELEVENASSEVKQNEQHINSPECVTTEADGQSKLYGQDVEQEMVIKMDHGETESIGVIRPADEREKNMDENTQEKTEIENQGPEVQVPADAFVPEEERKLLGETMDDKVELEVENTSKEVKQNEQQSSPECVTTEADGRHEQIQKVIAGEMLSRHEDLMEISRPGMKRGFDRVSKDLPVENTEVTFDLDLQAFEDSSLDFTVQKSRIAVKNPLVRPPKDPRKLLYMVSVEPLPPQPPACAQKAGVSVPSKVGIGFKLPGLGAGLPVLRKTEFGKKAREEGEAERTLHPQQKEVAVTEDSVKPEQVSAKPKWTPPKHPGMGGPLMMAELKSKLKKPVKE